MSQDDRRPEVVDLSRYRRARKPAPQPTPPPKGPKRQKRRYAPPKREPFLGDQRGAGLIVMGVVVVLLLLWLGPLLF